MRSATVFLLLACSALFAQTRPQLTWQGYITGGATLFIQGNQVDMQGRSTGAVDRPKYHFSEALPTLKQDVSVRVRRGRGRVEVSEQPASENDFTAAVELVPPGDRPEFYVIDFYWKRSPARSDK